ncbi:MAG: S8 family serine peptidase [Halanaerobiales bacterium]|nr:S8 family serine peptidase [Halanaerobiales bacterium]
MIDKFNQKEEVKWSEPNYIYHTLAQPNDPDYRDQWGHITTNLEAAWDIQKGNSSVTVAVVDSGVIPSHPDLANNLLQGADFVGGSNENPVEDYNATNYDPTDENEDGSHGTHVSGIIGAVTDNSEGVAGVNWKVDILPVRVLGADETGTNWDIAEGIYYAIDQGTDVINLSLGRDGTQSSSSLETEALNYANQHGVITFAASGNAGTTPVEYPAQYDSTVAVGATNINNQVTSYSNYGPNLDLVAPGGTYNDPDVPTSIYSTWGYYNSGDPVSDYKGIKGSSMATPYASGIAALLIADGVSGVYNIKDRMTSTAVDLRSEGKDEKSGHGLVDAYGALLNKELKNPYVFAANIKNGAVYIKSEMIKVNDDGTYTLNQLWLKKYI